MMLWLSQSGAMFYLFVGAALAPKFGTANALVGLAIMRFGADRAIRSGHGRLEGARKHPPGAAGCPADRGMMGINLRLPRQHAAPVVRDAALRLSRP
jgi:hypothetical protein